MSDATQAYRQYICRACGLIYDEAEGDPDSGLAPGTRFEDIPDDWECPLCGVTKSDFELFEKKQPIAAPEPALFNQGTGIVIVGAGLAGWATVEAIREMNATVPITLVCACTGDRYHKPELSVALSRGLTRKKLVRETGREAAARLGVRLLHNTFATGLTPATYQLRTTRGTLNYTHLILAQGSKPQMPEQLSSEHCWRINDLRCWNALAQQLQAGEQTIAIIGAGMVGCELAEDMAGAGHTVTLINRDEYPLAHMLPEKAGQRLLKSMTQQGITHRATAKVESVSSNDANKTSLHFADGTSEVFDQVIVATGLRTENRLAQQAGLVFNRGIVVDAHTLRSSADDIYALGDCISINGEPCRFIEPIMHQARVIAHSILGSETKPYQHQPPVIRLKTRSLPVVMHGLPQPDLPWKTVVDTGDELIMEQHADAGVSAQVRLQKSNQTQAA